ncbi:MULTISPECIES: sugar porter family MFS transporter [Flavobacteriaceae]|uniref:sugar porter family MFS transporter n=1 Tax=Flavobacteriaceae TaxID=49546 RepID=UPI001491B33C|nr:MULTISPECIES: sugar porter family MFS transporter [Allomuricauda]MDC6367319.1 sugar porter family MFS transporter [Muricauda sp. AC10]
MKENQAKNYITLLFVSTIAALGGFLFGYDTGVINGTQFYFSKYFELDPATKGWVVGSALLGCFTGAIVSGPLSKQYGRKVSLIISAILFTISAWGSGLPDFLPQTVRVLVFFRIIGGLGIGIASMNAPMYIAELSPAHIRGRMVTLYQMAVVFGFFIVFFVTYQIGAGKTEAFNIQVGWRYMFWSELVPCILFLLLLFLVPKSPRWLLLKKQEEASLKVLAKIHGLDQANTRAKEIKDSISKDTSIGIKDIFKNGILPIILIGSGLSFLQQFTGINAVLYYGADIFEKALGFGQEDVLAQQILLAGVNVAFTILAMVTVDKWGRKPLIISGSLGMLFGFALLGITIMTDNVGLLSLIGILFFVGAFAMSMGPVVWVILSEMFPNKIRAIGMSIAVAVQWGANYLVSQSFPIVAESKINVEGIWQGSLPYFLFMFFIVLIIWFVNRLLPETKGKTLEDIETVWKERYRNK